MEEKKHSSFLDEFTVDERGVATSVVWDRIYRLVVFKARTFRYILLVIVGYALVIIGFSTVRITHNSESGVKLSCDEHVNVAFIKTHKSGSTTVANVLLRYAFQHHLSVVLPNTPDRVWLGWPGPFDKRFIQSPYQYSMRGENYNILAHHAVYNEKAMEEVMPHNTIYVSILRHPFSNFRSAFRCYKVAQILNISGSSPLNQFLQNPDAYERPHRWDHDRPIDVSITKNLMSADLGLSDSNYSDDQAIREYIQHIDSNFNLILILEHFDESMVLLKRILCWKLEHILYVHVTPSDNVNVSMNANIWNVTSSNVTEILASHRAWSKADYMFYEFFNRTLWDKINDEGPDFMEEVHHYKDMIKEVNGYCGGLMSMTKYFPRTKWNDDFYITSRTCNMMKLNDLHFTDIFTTLHAKHF